MKPTLDKLERIFLRKAWVHETGEFTPWLEQVALQLSGVLRPLVKGLDANV